MPKQQETPTPRKYICTGLLAHVDSGKTTLAEGLLYRAGALRRLGRVDHRDAFLDTDAQERARGITIFAKQAVLTLPAAGSGPETCITLLDTPGHVDFSAEAERALQVLDYAVLVISGTDGVQAHTETLWKLLARYRVPTFVFVNKMDLRGADAAVRLRELRGRFGDGCVDFTGEPDPEALALCSEPLMEEVLANGAPAPDTLAAAIARRQVFPCFFGAALRLEGLDRLLEALQALTRMPPVWPEFGARVFKISQDDAGTRLTWLKVTGGTLPVKAVLPGGEKADALRLYNGSKFRLVNAAVPGMVVAVAGPARTRPGQGLGAEADAEAPLLEPVLNYRADCPGADPHTLLKALQTLEDEDPQLHVAWRDDLAEVHVQLMGEVQLEILQSILQSRFGLAVSFSEGGILYKETLTAAVEGIGHYEPLRHYAEVHLLLEPAPRGSGVQLAADCPPDTLAENWQRLVLTHLAERTHPGVLTGAPLTDVKITLAAGRAHQKHTEGGDFRQATYRAVRQGLRTAAARGAVQLLEPWYDFTLELPAGAVGRAMADVQRMCGAFDAPETLGDTARLRGRLPVATARGYAREVAAYTHGLGRWNVLPAGYDACHDAESVIAASGYDPAADVENPADSVFCSHGAGYTVPWDEVPARAHVDSGLTRRLSPAGQPPEEDAGARRRRAEAYRGTLEQDKELLAIFERTYGKIRRRGENGADAQKAARAALHTVPARTPPRPQPTGPDYLLVDGYNVIFAWDELRRLAEGSLDAARRRLMDILCNYAGYRRCVPILVFDAYKVRGGAREVERYHNLYVVYTREAETADMYIERATHELAKERRTRVVSSDGAEQVIVLGHGALRVSARAFAEEVAAVEKEIREFLQE
ncbi:MAG TPA: TetM/TetW/TetO/TetS family tetracycline resistance ribosomal protection protein [Candidatus Gemmiger avistercoris]|uniref:TetM/TetW/TetO/TetS family tetracycline resistance ribosomal protection protein n=1 Tax=Candidatus Gemmiger avistercoris TaxID=2838606 RepID=A0A9D2FK92_9FIRM|nr:TetM/TetW/TetO/TetS family tetracycline resistance ribosomal protection protein [uncultured Subdoligranulum sp.]HIZ62788.1 TetM/TetW/TetO/TetS family tetracycline resistance ribosomal protection protein [Candidatus Gemmiger avistercoris]